MKRQIMLGAAFSLAALPLLAETPVAEVKYMDGAVEQSLTGAPGDAAAGAKVMTDRGAGNCVACHVVSAMPDVPFQGNIGPALDGAAGRWTEAELRGIVADAKHTFEGSMMPSFYKSGPYIRQGDDYTGKGFDGTLPPILTAVQVEDVVAYLLTLKE